MNCWRTAALWFVSVALIGSRPGGCSLGVPPFASAFGTNTRLVVDGPNILGGTLTGAGLPDASVPAMFGALTLLGGGMAAAWLGGTFGLN